MLFQLAIVGGAGVCMALPYEGDSDPHGLGDQSEDDRQTDPL